jgi:hypothetical protein
MFAPIVVASEEDFLTPLTLGTLRAAFVPATGRLRVQKAILMAARGMRPQERAATGSATRVEKPR